MQIFWDILYISSTIITIIMKWYVIKLCYKVFTANIIVESEYGKSERKFIRWFWLGRSTMSIEVW